MMNPEDAKRKATISRRSKHCPVGIDLATLGRKWTVHILMSIGLQHVDRFNQILRSLPGLTSRVLIMRLNELEESGLITPNLIRERPRLVRWTLTEKGEDALPIVEGYFSFTKKWHPNATLKNHRADSVKRPSLLELVEQRKQGIVG
jgi:DNA-binding HxlR family transcriptional regulator